MEIKLIDFGGIAPSRNHYNDAGADIFTNDHAVLKPHTISKIPLGIGLEIPDGYVAFIFPRSGMSSNKGVTTEIVPIDSGYRGEIHAIVYNANDVSLILEKHTKVGQLVVFPIAIPTFSTGQKIERNEKAFGSSGDK
jgi:dUTP pyrophosphatase